MDLVVMLIYTITLLIGRQDFGWFCKYLFRLVTYPENQDNTCTCWDTFVLIPERMYARPKQNVNIENRHTEVLWYVFSSTSSPIATVPNATHDLMGSIAIVRRYRFSKVVRQKTRLFISPEPKVDKTFTKLEMLLELFSTKHVILCKLLKWLPRQSKCLNI